MTSSPPRSLLDDENVRIILFVALAVQIIFAVNAIGYWHPDQHHSIIEFATYKLGITPLELMARELPEQVRQTLQVWVFLGVYQIMQFLHLGDAYTVDTVLRAITGLLNFALFNYIILRTFRSDSRLTLYTVLIIANFSWTLPYIRTQFSSEVYGGLTYFAAILLYRHFRAQSMTVGRAMLVGFVLSLAFFFRFQIGFAMIGLGIWLLFVDKASLKTIAGMTAGFLIGTGVNFGLDSAYYGELVFTPYNYWNINISEGRAMGHKSAWNYVGVLSLALTAPPLSIVLLSFFARGLYTRLKDPFTSSVLVFLAVHFVVPHKEPRFLFPMAGILPVILGYGLRDYLNRLPPFTRRKAFAVGAGLLVMVSGLVNAVLLGILMFVPVAQHIAFTKTLNDYFDDDEPVHVVFYQRTPYETPTVRNVATYYLHSKKPNIEMTTIGSRAEFLERVRNHEDGTYFVSTYDRLVRDRLVDVMDCTPLAVSSTFLHRINRWVRARGGSVLPELWTLYECDDGAGDSP